MITIIRIVLFIVLIYIVALGLGTIPYLVIPDVCYFPLFCNLKQIPYCSVEVGIGLFTKCPTVGMGMIALMTLFFGTISFIVLSLLYCCGSIFIDHTIVRLLDIKKEVDNLHINNIQDTNYGYLPNNML